MGNVVKDFANSGAQIVKASGDIKEGLSSLLNPSSSNLNRAEGMLKVVSGIGNFAEARGKEL